MSAREAVYVVRDKKSKAIVECFVDYVDAVDRTDGSKHMTITRETLLTPEQAAVLALAWKYCDNPNLDTARQLRETVNTLRAQEGE